MCFCWEVHVSSRGSGSGGLVTSQEQSFEDQKYVKQINTVLLGASRTFTSDICAEFANPKSTATRRMQVLNDTDTEVARAVSMDDLLERVLEETNKESVLINLRVRLRYSNCFWQQRPNCLPY